MNNLNSVFQFAFVGVYVPATISFGDNFNCKGIHKKYRKGGEGAENSLENYPFMVRRGFPAFALFKGTRGHC